MSRYKTDNNKYIVNYSNVFYNVGEIHLQIINSCKYIYKDTFGKYVKYATSFDCLGNVYFEKRYIV